MKMISIRKDGALIATAWHATGYFARLRGLLGRSLEEGGGLMLSPCNSIHTIGMQYKIDAVYLDRAWRVLRVDEALAIGKFWPIQRGARHVLELPEGSARKYGVTAGDTLEVKT